VPVGGIRSDLVRLHPGQPGRARKKLRAAARQLISPGGQRDGLDDLAQQGLIVIVDEDGSPEAPGADPEPFGLWPDNVTAVALFCGLLTQWRMGPNGPIGLDYAALPLVARSTGVRPRQMRQAFDGLQTLEAEALTVWSEQARDAAEELKRKRH
jgi:hypothetical protein